MTITEPGLVYDMDDETYHADPVPGGSLSSTFARLLTTHVPAKAEARRANRVPTKAMNLGKAVHAHALGAGPDLIVWEFDGRTKEGKAERAAVADVLATEAAVAVTAKERDQILAMADVLKSHPEIRSILAACQSEVSGFWTNGEVWMRARYDLLGDVAAWDYKTTIDCTREGFTRSLGKYGYHQQSEFYQRGLRALGHAAGREAMQFICQETEPPYLVQIHEPDDEAMDIAEMLNDKAIATYTEAQQTGVYKGYDSLFAEPSPLPSYYLYNLEEVEMVI